MKHLAFKMKLRQGFAEEYKRRHDEIWPALKELLYLKGITDYYIYLDEETHLLFATLQMNDITKLDELPNDSIMRDWWNFMSDIMETNKDKSPVSIPLKEVFCLSVNDYK